MERNGKEDRVEGQSLTRGAPQPATSDGVALRIREARRALGLTQDELARRVGVSRSAIAQWETDRTGQIRANLTRVAAVLGVSIGYLITGDRDVGAVNVESADEGALLRLYREIREPGRTELLRSARRIAAAQSRPHGLTD